MTARLIGTGDGWKLSSRLPQEEWTKVRHLFSEGIIYDEGEPIETAYLTNSREKVLEILGIPDEIAEKKSVEKAKNLAIENEKAELEAIFADQLCTTEAHVDFYEGTCILAKTHYSAYAYFEHRDELKCVGIVVTKNIGM